MSVLRDFARRAVLAPVRQAPRSVLNPVSFCSKYLYTVWQFMQYRRASTETIRLADVYPCIHERTATSGTLGDLYTYQDTWAARKIWERMPDRHVDVASSRDFLAMLSVFVDVITIDIRPVVTTLPRIEARKGDVCHLPFEDGSITSLSSLCVIEHIGLGRYGDPLDPHGTGKAAVELSRVLRPGGDLYVSGPTEAWPRVHFNAHRTHTPGGFVALFPGCRLVSEIYAVSTGFLPRDAYDAAGRPYAYGCYHFTR